MEQCYELAPKLNILQDNLSIAIINPLKMKTLISLTQNTLRVAK